MNRHPADALADVREQLRELRVREKELRDCLIAGANPKGDEWVAVVCPYEKDRIDTAALVRHFGAEFLKPFTQTTSMAQIRLTKIEGRAVAEIISSTERARLRRQRPIPEAVRCAVFRRARGCCEGCGCEAALDLHHLTYRREGREPIFGYETECDLRALCRECHHKAHLTADGNFVGDIDELNEGRLR